MKAQLEKVITQDDSTVRAFKFSAKTFDSPWHVHPEYELTYIIDSVGSRYVGNNISDYHPGELVLLGSNLPHCWRHDTSISGKAESLVIQWPTDLMDSLLKFNEIQYALEGMERGVFFKNPAQINIQDRMTEIIESSSLKRYMKFVELLQALMQLKEKTYLAGASYAYDASQDTNNRIETVQNFVSKYYGRKIKLAEIANELNMTEQSFSRFFSKAMKRPFFVFLNEYRVNRVSRLLVETDMQVAEIGFRCGYESLPFFYQQFKKFKGYSPLEFRKMYRKLK